MHEHSTCENNHFGVYQNRPIIKYLTIFLTSLIASYFQLGNLFSCSLALNILLLRNLKQSFQLNYLWTSIVHIILVVVGVKYFTFKISYVRFLV